MAMREHDEVELRKIDTECVHVEREIIEVATGVEEDSFPAEPSPMALQASTTAETPRKAWWSRGQQTLVHPMA